MILAVIVVSAIGAGLAAVLVFADRVIANYGPCEITVNDDKKFTVDGGGDLLEALRSQKIFSPSACGGRATCGVCKIKALDGAGPLLPTEEPFLDEKERLDNIRLSCQVKVRNDIRIEIPEELLAVKEFTCVCTKISDLTYDIKGFQFELQEPKTIDFVPGQYIQILTPAYEGNDEEVYRAYSLSSNPDKKNIIEIIIRLVPGGICTTYCFEHLKQGDTIKLNGPYGEFRLSETDAPIIFIAGGSGMAPINCILHQMKNSGNKRAAKYFFGVNEPRDMFMLDEMKQFEKELENFKYIPVMARPGDGAKWDGETGLVTEAVERNINNAAESEAYLCGSPGMIDASIKVLKQLGMPEDKIYYDKFS